MPLSEQTPTPSTFQQPGDGCQMHGLLETLSGPWTLHILCSLAINGPMRFGQLKRHIVGISPRLLTVRLRTLQANGFVHRTVSQHVPPEVTYTPASRLDELQPMIKGLRGLALKWREEDVGTNAQGAPGPSPRVTG